LKSPKDYRQVYIVLLDNSVSMSKSKTDLIEILSKKLLNKLPRNSYYILSLFDDKLITNLGFPQLATEANINKTLEVVRNCQNSSSLKGGLDIWPALFEAMNLSFMSEPAMKENASTETMCSTGTPNSPGDPINFEELPRSIILVSNGNLSEPKRVEHLMLQPDRKPDITISTICIGSGASDSVLRVISEKGNGVMESILNEDQIDYTIECMIEKLRSSCVRNIKLEENDQILAVLPVFRRDDRILKSNILELDVYFKGKLKKEPINIELRYNDDEKKEQVSAVISFNADHEDAKNEDMYRDCMHTLLRNADMLVAHNRVERLVKEYGDKWDTDLAVWAQIFTEKTAYLTVCSEKLQGVEQMTKDLDEAGLENRTEATLKREKVVVPSTKVEEINQNRSEANDSTSTTDKSGFSKADYSMYTQQYNTQTRLNCNRFTQSKGNTPGGESPFFSITPGNEPKSTTDLDKIQKDATSR
jgi:hypothetical protein